MTNEQNLAGQILNHLCVVTYTSTHQSGKVSNPPLIQIRTNILTSVQLEQG